MRKLLTSLLPLMLLAVPAAVYADIAPIPASSDSAFSAFGLGSVFLILGAALGAILVVLVIIKQKKK